MGIVDDVDRSVGTADDVDCRGIRGVVEGDGWMGRLKHLTVDDYGTVIEHQQQYN